MLCANLMQFELQLLEPRTLKLLARYPLPPRPSTFHALITLDPDKIMADTSGAYFYVDEQNRVVIADAEQHIQRVVHHQDATGAWSFEKVDDWDLSAKVPHDCVRPTSWFPKGECDPITGVMPDHQGLIWWITRRGRIGTLNPNTGAVGQAFDNNWPPITLAPDGTAYVGTFGGLVAVWDKGVNPSSNQL